MKNTFLKSTYNAYTRQFDTPWIYLQSLGGYGTHSPSLASRRLIHDLLTLRYRSQLVMIISFIEFDVYLTCEPFADLSAPCCLFPVLTPPVAYYDSL